jgi:hypothetical protein
MRKRLHVVTVLCLLAAGALVAAATVIAAGPERYLHVKVEDGDKGESVNVNVPLSMAEKILPTINNHDLHQGRVTIHDSDFNGVDIRAILEAVRNAPDNDFVTVKEKGRETVRVAKSGGNIVIHVKDHDSKDQQVDVTVPMKVVDALFATAKDNELDVLSALRALSDAGDILLVTVQDTGQKVRIWVDSHSTAE